MRAIRQPVLFALLTLSSFTAGVFAVKSTQMKPSKAVEEDRAKYPVSDDAIELKHRFSLPKVDSKDSRSFLWRPHGITGSPSGDIYVADEYQHKIFAFNEKGQLLSSFGRKGQGPGDLNFPQKVAFLHPRSLLIYDMGNMRFQILSTAGEYEASFKIPKGYRSFCLDDHGEIYATNANVADVNHGKEKLVDVFTKEGTLLRSFGEGLPSRTSGIFNFADIAQNGTDEFLVAFECYPIVRKYSVDGRLLGEYRLNDPLMEERGKRNRKNATDPATSDEARRTYPVISSFISYKSRIYLMRAYPRIEIMELDSHHFGIKKTYWTEDAEAGFWSRHFLVLDAENRTQFFVINERESRIDVYSPVSSEKQTER